MSSKEKDKSSFAKRLSSLRKEKGLSQYKLADAIGYSRGLIGNYEQGSRQPDYDTLINLANFFNVTVDYIIGNSELKNCDSCNRDIFLEEDEKELLEIYRKLTFKYKYKILGEIKGILETLQEQAVTQEKNNMVKKIFY